MTPVRGCGARKVGLVLLSALLLSGSAACSRGDSPANPAPAATSTADAAPSAFPTEPAPSAAPPSTKSSSEASAPPTTPQPGSVEQTVPAGEQTTAKPVKLGDSTSPFDDSLSVRISRMRTGTAKAELPGQVPGPAVIFDVAIKNASDHVVDLNQLVVTVLDDKQVPASRITTKPARAMPHAVAGESVARGRFVYVVPKKTRDPVTVQVSLTAEQPVLIFRGRVR